MPQTVKRSSSLPSAADEYGIGVASDSDDDSGPEHVSLPNLSRAVSSESSFARTVGSFTGDGSVGNACSGDAEMEIGGRSMHLFFIWVDPSDPCEDRLNEWPLPDKYLIHVRRWEERYQVQKILPAVLPYPRERRTAHKVQIACALRERPHPEGL